MIIWNHGNILFSHTVLNPLVLASTDDPLNHFLHWWLQMLVFHILSFLLSILADSDLSFPLSPFTLHLSVFNLLHYWILIFLYFFFFCFYIFYVKKWLIRKDPDAGKDWRQEEKGTTGDEIVGWHHWLNEHEFEQAPGLDAGQGSLVCCSPWGCKKLDTTERLNWTDTCNFPSAYCFHFLTPTILHSSNIYWTPFSCHVLV